MQETRMTDVAPVVPVKPLPAHRTAGLFQPLQVGGLALKNRVVMSPMTRTMAPTGVPNDDNAAYYRKRAAGGAGLIITVGSIGMTGQHIDTLMGDGSNVASLDRLLELFERGDFDLIAVGRGMLVNPDWANKVRDGRVDQLNNWNPEALKALE